MTSVTSPITDTTAENMARNRLCLVAENIKTYNEMAVNTFKSVSHNKSRLFLTSVEKFKEALWSNM